LGDVGDGFESTKLFRMSFFLIRLRADRDMVAVREPSSLGEEIG